VRQRASKCRICGLCQLQRGGMPVIFSRSVAGNLPAASRELELHAGGVLEVLYAALDL